MAIDPVAIIIIILLIGTVAGWLAGVIYTGAGFGLVGNIIIGILGAIIAGILHFSGLVGEIVTAGMGAIVLLFLVSLVHRSAEAHLLLSEPDVRTPKVAFRP